MDYAFDTKENIIKIATCGDDKTVIYWNLRLDENIHNSLLDSKIKHITYSKYIRHIFYFSKNYEHFKINKDNIGANSNEEDNMINLTSIKFSVNNYHI
jgi:O-glycosyl hydrolase